MILMRANLLLGALEGMGSENLDFFGPKWDTLCLRLFQGPKKSRFLGPPLLMALEMGVAEAKTFRFIPYKQQVHYQLIYS